MALGLFNQGGVPPKSSLTGTGLTFFSSPEKHFSRTVTSDHVKAARENVENLPKQDIGSFTDRNGQAFTEAAGLLFLGNKNNKFAQEVDADKRQIDALDLAGYQRSVMGR